MRLFNDMVSAILGCDKPVVIARVNGMRIGGGQEIGMAADFTIAQDLAKFGQAGPKHGSAAIGGATDFLPVMVGCERAMGIRHPLRALLGAQPYPGRLGISSDRPRLKIDGKFVANPLVETDRYLDEFGKIIHGEFKTGDALAAGKGTMARGGSTFPARQGGREAVHQADLHLPGVPDQELEELRKPKIDAWNRNKEDSRAWPALNMMNEARTGFRAFNEGPKEDRRNRLQFALRQRSPRRSPWTEAMIEEA